MQGGTFDTREIFWGQLAGCMECLNNGTTTIVDHSHLNYAEDHREFYEPSNPYNVPRSDS
jgi:hypothetical protein